MLSFLLGGPKWGDVNRWLQRLEVEKSVFSGFYFTFLRPWDPGPCYCSCNPKAIPVSYYLFRSIKISVLLNINWSGFISLATKSCELCVTSSGSPSLTTLANLVSFMPLVIFILLPYYMFYHTDCSMKLVPQIMSNFLCVYCSFLPPPHLILKYKFHEVRDFILFISWFITFPKA